MLVARSAAVAVPRSRRIVPAGVPVVRRPIPAAAEIVVRRAVPGSPARSPIPIGRSGRAGTDHGDEGNQRPAGQTRTDHDQNCHRLASLTAAPAATATTRRATAAATTASTRTTAEPAIAVTSPVGTADPPAAVAGPASTTPAAAPRLHRSGQQDEQQSRYPHRQSYEQCVHDNPSSSTTLGRDPDRCHVAEPIPITSSRRPR